MDRVKSFTLVELLIAIAVASLLFGVVILMFRSSLESFFISQGDLFLQKALDDILTEVCDGEFKYYGLIDAKEFVALSETSVSFIPLWVDYPKDRGDSRRFILTKALKEGTALPLAEVKFPYSKEFKAQEITFYDDIIEFNQPLALGSQVRAVYTPRFSDAEVVFSFDWDKKKKVLRRKYKNIESSIPVYSLEGPKISDVHFEYFDNTNTKLMVDAKTGRLNPHLFPLVSAIRVWVKVELADKSREGFIFINLRNRRAAGSGISIKEGTEIKIPDSYHVRTLSLVNIMGVAEGGIIEIEIRPKTGDIWRIKLELGFKDKNPLIKKYTIDYPVGNIVYTETINMTTDLALNFLTLGASGRYDYDYDVDVQNVVILEGDVELVVTKMNASGASLYIRP